MKTIDNRRSVRKFQDKKIEPEKTEQILRAAMQAPSAHNAQPWEFIVVEDKQKLKNLSKAHKYAKFLEGAALAIVPVANPNLSKKYAKDFVPQDLALATQNMMLEAVELGLGSTMIGIYPNPEKMNIVSQTLGIPNDIYPFTILAIGYPLDEDANHYVNRFDTNRIHHEEY